LTALTAPLPFTPVTPLTEPLDAPADELLDELLDEPDFPLAAAETVFATAGATAAMTVLKRPIVFLPFD